MIVHERLEFRASFVHHSVEWSSSGYTRNTTLRAELAQMVHVDLRHVRRIQPIASGVDDIERLVDGVARDTSRRRRSTDGVPSTTMWPISGRKLAHGVASLNAMKYTPVPPSETPVRYTRFSSML